MFPFNRTSWDKYMTNCISIHKVWDMAQLALSNWKGQTLRRFSFTQCVKNTSTGTFLAFLPQSDFCNHKDKYWPLSADLTSRVSIVQQRPDYQSGPSYKAEIGSTWPGATCITSFLISCIEPTIQRGMGPLQVNPLHLRVLKVDPPVAIVGMEKEEMVASDCDAPT